MLISPRDLLPLFSFSLSPPPRPPPPPSLSPSTSEKTPPTHPPREKHSCDRGGTNANGASSPAAAADGGLSALLEAARSWRRVVVVSGSGLSASSGMSTFSTPGGLYERAASRAGLANGKSLFCWSFFERRRPECLAFLADVHAEAAAAGPTKGHAALARLAAGGLLSRHFTLNIDGLAERAGMRTWRLEEDPEFNGEQAKEEGEEEEEGGGGGGEEEGREEAAARGEGHEGQGRRRRRASPAPIPLLPPLDPRRGVTVELHGNVHELVCPDCHRVSPVTETALAALRARVDLPCVGCPGGVSSSSDDDDGGGGGDDKGNGGGGAGDGTREQKSDAASPSAPPPSGAEATGGPLRLRVMLYDDAQGDAITPDEVLDLLERDAAGADAVLWVGLSFEQSATTGYFRRVRAALKACGRCPGAAEEGIGARDGRGTRGRGRGAGGARGGRGRGRGGRGGGSGDGGGGTSSASPNSSPSRSSRSPSPPAIKRPPLPCLQVIVNPNADDAAFNLLSSCHNRDGIDVLEVRRSSDEALEELAKVLLGRSRGGEGGREGEEGLEEEGMKKGGAASAATAAVAADASTGGAATAAPPPPPPPPNALSAAQRPPLGARDASPPPAPSELERGVAPAREALAAAGAKAPAGGPPSLAAAFRPPPVAPASAFVAPFVAPFVAGSVAAGAPVAPPVVAPVAAAFDSAPPLSDEGDEEAAGKEEEGGGGKALTPAAAAAFGAAATTALPARIRLTCTSEPGDDEDDDDDDEESCSGSDGEKGGGQGASFCRDGEH